MKPAGTPEAVRFMNRTAQAVKAAVVAQEDVKVALHNEELNRKRIDMLELATEHLLKIRNRPLFGRLKWLILGR